MIKEKNGFLYSTQPFDGFKYRYVIEYQHEDIQHNLHVYSTNEDKDNVLSLFTTSILKNYPSATDIKLAYQASAEQDERTGKFIENFLNSLDT